jgi:anti-sigma regulatory factor (Ser/Thr protein kinase)
MGIDLILGLNFDAATACSDGGSTGNLFAAGPGRARWVVGSVAASGASGRRLHLCLPADPARLGALRRRVRRWAAELAVPEDVVVDLQLVLGEAVSNGVEHAYRGGTRGTVEVELELRTEDDPAVQVRVVDHGRWRPIPMRKGGRGRGLAIIDQLTRGLRISISADGTQLTCAVPVRS